MTKETARAACPTCKGERECLILFSCADEPKDKDTVFGYRVQQYEVLKCCGCHTKFYRYSDRLTGNALFTEGECDIVRYCPECSVPTRNFPTDTPLFMYIGLDNSALLHEVYTAFNSGLLRLAAMGIRSFVEQISILLTKKKHKTIARCIKSMVEDGWLSEKQQETISAVIELGHSAIHRGYVPNSSQVSLALDIIESTVQLLIINNEKTKKLKDKLPQRDIPAEQ